MYAEIAAHMDMMVVFFIYAFPYFRPNCVIASHCAKVLHTAIASSRYMYVKFAPPLSLHGAGNIHKQALKYNVLHPLSRDILARHFDMFHKPVG